LYRVKDRAFEAIAQRCRDAVPTTEFDVQRLMVSWFADEGLVSDSAPVVAAQQNAGNPHYLPTAERTRRIAKNELVLLDLWAKKEGNPEAVYADITWVGFTGGAVPDEVGRVFDAVAAARDAAARLAQDAALTQHDLRGWQVD